MDQKISENKMNIQILRNRKIKNPIIEIDQDLDHLNIKINMKIIKIKKDNTKTDMKTMKEINIDQNQIMILLKSLINLQ